MGAQKINWRILSILCGFVISLTNSSFGVPWANQNPIKKYVDCIWPNQSPVLEGTQETGTCRLIRPDSPYSLADLNFSGPTNISKVLSKDRNTLNITFSFQHLPLHDFQTFTYKWPNISYGIETVSFRVNALPLVPENISCEVQNWETMVCKWRPTLKEQQSHVHNTKVTNMLEWRKGKETFKECPNARGDECHWKVNEVPEDLTSVAVGDLLEVKVKVTYTNDSHTFYSAPRFFNTSSIVRVAVLGNLTISQKERDLIVSWPHPSPGHCIKCHIYAISLHETKFVETESKDDRVKVQFRNLLPNTIYNISSSCRACSAPLWGDITTRSQHTLPQVPEHHPMVRPDAYEVNYCNGSQCSVTLFWQPLQPYEENGNNFTYGVRSSQGHNFNTTKFAAEFYIDTEKAFDVQVSAINKEGSAPGDPISVCLHLKGTSKAEFSVEARNSSSVYVEVEGEEQNFTLFWCPRRTIPDPGYPGNCKDYIQWSTSTGHSNNMTLTLPPDYGFTYKDYLFAVTTETSGSLSWSQCAFDLKQEPSPPEVHLGPAQESESMHLVWKPSPCHSKSSAFAESYIVTYCPVKSCPHSDTAVVNITCAEAAQSIPLPRTAEDHLIEDLPSGTPYVAWLISVSRNGQHSTNSVPVCHSVLAHWLTVKAIAGIALGCALLLFFLIAGAYFMVIRCGKARNWLKGDDVDINVPEKEKFSSQKTLNSEQLHPSLSRGIHNSCSSFDSGVGTISQSDYHHVFSMPMIRGVSSESEHDEVFDENARDHLTGYRHFPQSFNSLQPLHEEKVAHMKQMGKPNKSTTRSVSSRGSGYNKSLGSYVLQPGGAGSIKSSSGATSDYVVRRARNNSEQDMNTSNSNNNDHNASIEDVRCNISCKSLPLSDLNYVSTEDLPQTIITKGMLNAADQGYVVNNAGNSPSRTTNLHRSNSYDGVSSGLVTLKAQQNCAHYAVHPQTIASTPYNGKGADQSRSDEIGYSQWDQAANQRPHYTTNPGVSLTPQKTDTNGYVISDITNPGISLTPQKTDANGYVISDITNPGVSLTPQKTDTNGYVINDTTNPGLSLTPQKTDTNGCVISDSTNPGVSMTPQKTDANGYVIRDKTNPGVSLTPPKTVTNGYIVNYTQAGSTDGDVMSGMNDNHDLNTINAVSDSKSSPVSMPNFSAAKDVPKNILHKPENPSNSSTGYVMLPRIASSTDDSSQHPQCSDIAGLYNQNPVQPVSLPNDIQGYVTSPSANPAYVDSSFPPHVADISSSTSSEPYASSTPYSLAPTSVSIPTSSSYIPVPTSYGSSLDTPVISSGYVASPTSSPTGFVAKQTSPSCYVVAPLSSSSYTPPAPSSSGGISSPASYIPAISPSTSNAVTPVSPSLGYVTVPPTPDSYIAQPALSSSCVAVPHTSSGDGASPPTTQGDDSPSDYVITAPVTASGHAVTQESSSGYVSVPQTDNADSQTTLNSYVTVPSIPSSDANATHVPSTSNYVASLLTSPNCGCTAVPTTSPSSHVAAPLPFPDGYVVAPQPATEFPVGSSTTPADGYIAVPPSLSKNAAVMSPAISNGYVSTVPMTVSSYMTTPPPSSGSYTTTPPPSSSGYTTTPPLSSGYTTTPPPSSSGYTTTPPPSTSGYTTTPPPSSGYTTIPPPSSSGYTTTPPPSSSGYTTTTPPPSSSGYITIPPTSSSGYTTSPPPSSGYTPSPPPPSSSGFTTTPPHSSSGYTTTPPPSSGYTTTPPPSSGYTTTPPPSSSGYTTTPPLSSSGYVAAPSISSDYITPPTLTSVPPSATACSSSPPSPSGYASSPPTSSGLRPPNYNAYTAAPQASNKYDATQPMSSDSYVSIPTTSSAGNTIALLAVDPLTGPPSTSAAYIVAPSQDSSNSEASVNGYTTGPPPASANGHTAMPLSNLGDGCETVAIPASNPSKGSVDSPSSPTNGYTFIPPLMPASGDAALLQSNVENGYIATPPSSVVGYVETPPNLTNGIQNMPPICENGCGDMPSSPTNGYGAMPPLKHPNHIVAIPQSSGDNGYVAMPSADCVSIPLSNPSNGYVAIPESKLSNGYVSPPPLKQTSNHAPSPPSNAQNGYAAIPGPKQNECKDTPPSLPVNGYAAIPPSGSKSCNDEMTSLSSKGSDYVTNQPGAITQSFVLAM